MQTSVEFEILDSTHTGEARRKVQSLATNLGFDEETRTRISIIINEVATNILKHAVKGKIIASHDADGIEILAIDSGPGIANMAESMRDGHSTAGTPGTGLGAIKRQSDSFDVFSAPKLGTVLYSRVNLSKEPKSAVPKFQVGGVSVPYPGENICGDGWEIAYDNNKAKIAIVDGLGHGPSAAEATSRAMELFVENAGQAPATILNRCHQGMRSTRGAAMASATFDPESQVVTYCGIGNTVCVNAGSGDQKRMISYDGTVGLQARKIQEMSYAVLPNSMLILHTDGIATSWDLKNYPGLMHRHPSVIAGVLLRDFRRKDDSTVVVVRGLLQ